MVRKIPKDLAGLRDRALILLCFGAALRRSELVALDVEDIEWHRRGIVVTIRRSKTDQQGRGKTKGVLDGKLGVPGAVCAWIGEAGIKAGPVFRGVDRGKVGTARMAGDIPPGWPCALLPADPPSVADKLANPSADDLLPQVLQLTPRGAAWGTDEAGDGQGASPVMLQVWRGLAAHAAWNYATEWDLATQAIPSAITWSLPDWEDEYGLPDTCASGEAGTAQRVAAVRARFGAQGGQSPAYFVCLAASLGYTITIDEPTQFHCDDSECIGDDIAESWFTIDDGECDDTPLESYELTSVSDEGDEVSDQTVWKYWVVGVQTLGESWFTIDDGECDFDPLEGFTIAADLECTLRRLCPPHTQLVFDYSALSA